LEALFGKHEIVKTSESPMLVETQFEKLTKAEWYKKKSMVSLENYERLKEIHKTKRMRFRKALDKFKWVKPQFGDPYYRIEMNATKLALLKNALEQDL
jgi:hypothetical protein